MLSELCKCKSVLPQGWGCGLPPRKCLGEACRGPLGDQLPAPGHHRCTGSSHSSLHLDTRQRAAGDGISFIPIVQVGKQSLGGLIGQPGRDREAGNSLHNALEYTSML